MNTEARKSIPVTLVTGFLGSGKTTLLNRILSESHGKRIAVIENEFGEVGIDDSLLTDSSSQSVFQMNNGCLCCTSNGDLVNTLLELRQRRDEFDYVVIETTGVANPAPVIQTFLLNEDISESFRLDAVVTLVDAKHLPLHSNSKECVQQIALADIIVLNKVDLVGAEELTAVSNLIQSKNKLARIHQVQRSALELKDIFDQDVFSETSALANLEVEEHAHDHDHDHNGCCGHEHHDHDHDGAFGGEHCDLDHGLDRHHHDEDITSVGLVVNNSLDSALFNNWFAELIQQQGDKIFRIKGILSVSGQGERIIVQTVHRVSEVTVGAPWGSEPRQSKIVFIGESLDRASLLTGLTSCLVASN